MSEQTIEMVLAGIVGEYEQSIINERSGSPEYKSWERRSVAKLCKVANSDLLAALKAIRMGTTEEFDTDLQEFVDAPMDEEEMAQIADAAIKAAEKQSAGGQS